MQKIKALIVMALLLAACGGNSGDGADAKSSAAKQKSYQWKMVTTWPKNFPGLGSAPENFAKLVARMSNGRLKIKVYGAGEVVPAMEVFSAVSSGTAEMGHSAAYYWKGKAPASVLFTAIPFGLNAQEMNGWLHYGGGLELWRELYAPFNLVPFAGGSTGVQMAGWFNRDIQSLEDFKGLKMRIPGIGGEVFSRAGGTAVSMPGGEIFTSLQTGVIDAAEWVAPYNDLAFGFHNVAKYYYFPGWHEPGAMLEFTVNKEAWQSLPDDLQAIIEGAARAINQDMLDEYTARNNAALIQLREKGVDIKSFPADVEEALRKFTDEVIAENVANDAMFAKVYASFDTFRKNVMEYHRISEQAYFELRDANL
ncbi:MAG: TRAP transporter substrate-binding protein [Gammaproteobacteria bacterium]|nr:TRAP transporter substrate-binding protein [Gammaproteobacteria bacterium]MBT8150164.1 TRAP transporter substrate-binding protein [Gammaproteobacteria bacterium]NND40342.1 TRAP transporter substrate-binding protein [Pseudomonadales bacterium]NNL10832.1 TRAP transporter substrate-binding protein [Pseudomonadales bacterium]NNM10380.1 TRAP transporter substrate-binding protein [Pseudomonadales bacterium]